jgi:superfamily II DNA helicase RecQ
MGDVVTLKQMVETSEAGEDESAWSVQKLEAILGYCESIGCRRRTCSGTSENDVTTTAATATTVSSRPGPSTRRSRAEGALVRLPHRPAFRRRARDRRADRQGDRQGHAIRP